MKSLKMSLIKAILFFVLAFIGNSSFAGTTMKAYVATGGDDLRGGNTAFIKVNFTDNTTSPEYVLSTSMGGGASMTFTKDMGRVIDNLSRVKSIVIRHDGSPRSGNPFDTYDNWNLQSLRVTFVINGTEENFFSYSGTPLERFTGALRIREFFRQPIIIPVDPPATSLVKVFLTTGTGELRGGNNAFMTINYTDGTTSPEYVLGGGWVQNSATTVSVRINKALSSPIQIKNIVIRHDGNRRAGNPFDTYGNWTLQAIRVALVMPNGVEQNVINLPGNPLVQFSGAVRVKKFDR